MKTHGNHLEAVSRPATNKFCKMFGNNNRFEVKNKALVELSETMHDNDPTANSEIPAGYTYLGQFIDHDITKDAAGGLSQEQLAQHDPFRLKDLEQQRTPALDLDSLYGDGPNSLKSAHLYEDDNIRFKIGWTIGLDDKNEFPNDLPRKLNTQTKAQALIADPRNDENLAVAQTHLAFLKFHNKVADTIQSGQPTLTNKALFNKTRETVIKHYQSIVLHDFLVQFVDPNIYDQIVVNDNPRFFNIVAGENPCMPIEFSGAAFRLHTIIRDEYNWNKFFNAEPTALGDGKLQRLFEFTGHSNFSGGTRNIRMGNTTAGFSAQLPSVWIIDWRRFYDFNGIVAQPDEINWTKPMDTRIANTLFRLPGKEGSLAAKNLIRGSKIGLPCAQELLKRTGIAPTAINEPTAKKYGLDKKTPLWYYLMAEAEQEGATKGKLGPLGSTILCETFLGLVKGSTISIFHETGWRPSLPSQNPNQFTMVDLLLFNNDLFPNVQVG